MTNTMDSVAVPISMNEEFVQCKNLEDTPVIFTWQARDYLIKPHATGFIPFEAMATSYGHPSAGLEEIQTPHGTIPARTYELRRVYGMQGVNAFMAKETGIDLNELLQMTAHKCEFYKLDGERITTVVDDPEGEANQRNYNAGSPNDPATLRQMIANQEQQIQYLKQAYDNMNPAGSVTVDSVPEDEPGMGMGTPAKARGHRGTIQTTPPPAMPADDIPGDDGGNPMTLPVNG